MFLQVFLYFSNLLPFSGTDVWVVFLTAVFLKMFSLHFELACRFYSTVGWQTMIKTLKCVCVLRMWFCRSTVTLDCQQLREAWQVRSTCDRCVDSLAGTLSLWQVCWASGRYFEPLSGTLSLWQVHWACGRYVESLAGTLSLWQVHWACGRYFEPLAGTSILWQIYWACGRYI